MDALSLNTQFLPLRLTGNPMGYVIDAVSDAIGDRQQLAYILSLNMPKSFGSGEFAELIELPGRELPPRTEFGATTYPGATFDLAVFLDDLLTRTTPGLSQAGFVTCAGMSTPFFARQRVENAGIPVAGTDKNFSLEYALKGKLSVEQFATWGDQFFSTYLASSRAFLTWQAADKWVDLGQPEWLYYLVNCSPKPTELRLRVNITYQDGSTDVMTAYTTSNVSQYTVYSMPVGFKALKLSAREAATAKTVHSYQVWISNEANARLSEIRTYYVNRDIEPNVLYLVYANSLGGYDTLRCSGQSSRQLTVKGTPAQRALDPSYLPTSAELVSLNRSGERVITVATGLLDGDQLDYLSELALTDELYVVTQDGLVNLVPTDSPLALQSDDEDLAGRVFSFRYGKTEVGFSALPPAPLTPGRQTRWVPVNTFCLINDTGVRTGYMGAAQLELRYVDDGSLVKPRQVKANTAGTDGYTPPVLSGGCSAASTPFLNALIQQPGTYRRSNCGADQDATVATLTIVANTYGAETADLLKSRIDQALTVMDTQAYADQYGSCLANPAGYAYAVPANRFHYRGNAPSRIGIETGGAPWMGNAWTMQNRGEFCFATGTNDLDFPTTNFDPYAWRVFVYGTAGKSARVRFFRNGTQYYESTFVYNPDGFEYHSLFPAPATMASTDKLYIQLTDL